VNHWKDYPVPALRQEALFGDRLVSCFAERPRSFYALFERSLAAGPQAEALVCGDLRWTYAQCEEAAARLAAGLAQQGVAAGDRVLMFIDNRAEFVFTLLALQRLGAVAVPVGVREQRPGLAYIARQCGAVAVVATASFSERIPEGQDAPALRLRVSVGPAPTAAWLAMDGFPAGAPAAPPHRGAETDVAVILYTSGTTGNPKGAMLTHLNIAHSAMHFQACMKLAPQDRSALAVPASHVTGLIAVIASMLQVGGAVIIVPEFKADTFIALLQAERVTHTLMVPAMYNLCLRQPAFADARLDAWRIGGYGGAPMPMATIEALAQRLPGLTLLNAYGATETTSPVTMMPMGDTPSHADSVGVVLPAARVVVMDEHGVEAPRGEVGELWIGGPMVVPGYWDNPEATASSFTAGYWHSGDLGSIDDQGYVRVNDRKKDMINRGGYKIFSIEVENALMAFPGILEAAVIARPCPVLGERVHAVVYGPGVAPDEAAVRSHCAQRLADYKVPETITWSADALPRNANGKVMKRLLRDAVDAAPA
jgi:O-succinylbenzoic acid--CoA ligase